MSSGLWKVINVNCNEDAMMMKKIDKIDFRW